MARKKKKNSSSKNLGAVDKTTLDVSKRIYQLRQEKGWSLEQLSASSGVSRSMLSQIERGEANPTLAVTLRIAQAFEMSLGDLVEATEVTTSIDVIRSDDAAYHYRTDKECCIRTLSPLYLEKEAEFYEVRLSAKASLCSSAHFRGTREFVTVQQGAVSVESGRRSVKLKKGDSASYRADVPHAIINTTNRVAMVFLVNTYRQL